MVYKLVLKSFLPLGLVFNTICVLFQMLLIDIARFGGGKMVNLEDFGFIKKYFNYQVSEEYVSDIRLVKNMYLTSG